MCPLVVQIERNINMFPCGLNGIHVRAIAWIDEGDSMIHSVVRISLLGQTHVASPAV